MLPPGLLEYDGSVPKLVNDIIHPKYKNLYLFGIAQPIWGAGSLIVSFILYIFIVPYAFYFFIVWLDKKGSIFDFLEYSFFDKINKNNK